MKHKVLWLQGVTCNGNSHSFFNYPLFENLLEHFDFLYHPLFETQKTLHDIVDNNYNIDILIIEGAIKKEGFQRLEVEMYDLFVRYGKKAKKIIAAGSCASFGGLLKEADPENSTGLLFDKDTKEGYLKAFENKIINIPGCPLHPEWIATILYMIKHQQPIEIDELHRPKNLYATMVHNGCSRNEYFEWKIDTKSFGLKEGCLFYEHGCQAPYTHGSCNKILWNDVSSKTRVGMPCIGCTEPSFPKNNLFSTNTNMGIPAQMPEGVPKRAYLTITGVAKAFKIERLEKRLLDD